METFARPPTLVNLPREKTRVQVVEDKQKKAVKLPVSLAAINFQSDGNLGYLVRSAACFGAEEVLVIGSLPPYAELKKLSCATNLFMTIKSFRNPSEFLAYVRENNIHLVSLELCSTSIDITDYRFPQDRKVCIVTGNETTGVPTEIILNSDCVIIPNPGIGPCMNTSQAANVALYEYVRQIHKGK